MPEPFLTGPAATPPGPPPRLRGKLAALSVLGGLLAGLPLAQVLRYQNAELQIIEHQRRGLDPVTHAVAVQRGLMLHRDLAARVLRGSDQDEPERRVRQGEVEDRVVQLATSLQAGAWERALRECEALHEDWMMLVQHIAARSLQPDESDQAHRLLVEQSLQVADLLAEIGGAGMFGADDTAQGLLRAARTLPRLTAQMAALASPGPGRDAAGQARDIAAAEASVARVLGAMNLALERPAIAQAGAREPLARATAAAGAAADRYFQQLRSAGVSATELRLAADVAVQAQFKLFDRAQGAMVSALAQRTLAAQGEQAQLVSAMAVIALLMLLVVSRLARAVAPPPGPAPQEEAAPPANAERRAAGELVQRLRSRAGTGRPQPDAASAPAAASRPVAQDTGPDRAPDPDR